MIVTAREVKDSKGEILGKIYSNQLMVVYADNKEYWYFQGAQLNGINNEEKAFRYMELKAFW